MSAPSYTPMEIAAARTLCRLQSTACNVDNGDLWALHGGDFLDEARAVLESAGVPDMLDALRLVVDLSSQEWQESDGRRMGATDNQGRRLWFISIDVMEEARAVVAKATKGDAA